MFNKQDFDNQFRAVLSSMEEGREYILTKEAWDESNQIRKESDFSLLDERWRKVYSFKVEDKKLLFDSRYDYVIIEDISQATTPATWSVMATVMVMRMPMGTAMAMGILTNQIEKKK